MSEYAFWGYVPLITLLIFGEILKMSSPAFLISYGKGNPKK